MTLMCCPACNRPLPIERDDLIEHSTGLTRLQLIMSSESDIEALVNALRAPYERPVFHFTPSETAS